VLFKDIFADAASERREQLKAASKSEVLRLANDSQDMWMLFIDLPQKDPEGITLSVALRLGRRLSLLESFMEEL
jgi:hypothetical protein